MRRRRRLEWITLAVLVLAPADSALAQTTARDTLPVVRSVEIEGNEHFSDAEIKRAIATRDSGCKSVFLSPLCWVGIGAFTRTERLDRRELRTDVARIRIFYFRRGYRHVEVDTTVVQEDRDARITFQVVEGEPVVVRALEVVGLEDIEGAEPITRNLPLGEGEPFSEVELSAARKEIERALANRGFPEAVVLVGSSIPRDDTLGAYVRLEAVPGPRSRIGEVSIEGTNELGVDDVRRLLTFRPGDLYREREIVRSQRSLYSMALFNYVNISRGPVESDSTVDVTVQINEADMRGVRVGIGVSTTECLQLQGSWAHRNFLGGTRKLELSGVLSNLGTAEFAQRFPCNQAGVSLEEDEVVRGPFNKINWRLRADFSQPWFLGTQNWLSLGVFSERQSLPNIYARVSYGGDVRISREISPGTGLVGTFRAGRDSLEEGSADFLFCTNFGVCQPDDIATLSESRWLSWIAVSFARSRTDAVLTPTRGYRLSLEGEHASRFTGSEWAYYRAEGEVSWYHQLGSSGSVLALRLRGGLVRPIGAGLEGVELTATDEAVTNPLKRQYAGGAYSVRGYAQNLLGPKVLLADPTGLDCDVNNVTPNNTWVCDPTTQGLDTTRVFPRPIGGENVVVGNAELRFPLSPERWTGVVFLDLGQVWTGRGGVSSGQTLSWSPGLGLRYRSPVGPLRLDVGYNTAGTERLKVVSELKQNGESIIVQLGGEDDNPIPFEYDPFDDTGLGGFLNRLQLHFSIGHAF